MSADPSSLENGENDEVPFLQPFDALLHGGDPLDILSDVRHPADDDILDDSCPGSTGYGPNGDLPKPQPTHSRYFMPAEWPLFHTDEVVKPQPRFL